MSEGKKAKVEAIIAKLDAKPISGTAPEKAQKIAWALYDFRNPPDEKDEARSEKWKARIDAFFTEGTKSDDPEIMAAVEHYYYSRSQVGNARYSETNWRIYVSLYHYGKKMGLVPRHNPNNPVTPPSKLQLEMGILGIYKGRDELKELNESNKSDGKEALTPPAFRGPPNFSRSYQGKRTSQFQVATYDASEADYWSRPNFVKD